MEQNRNLLKKLNSSWLQDRSSVSAGKVILLAEDSEADIYFLIRAIIASKVKNPIQVVRSGEEALAYLTGEGPFADRRLFPKPSVVFLDLRMASPDGFEILKWKERQPDYREVLFVAMSNFDSVSSINRAYASGASTFLSKPLNGEDIRNVVEAFEDYWLIKTNQSVPSSSS